MKNKTTTIIIPHNQIIILMIALMWSIMSPTFYQGLSFSGYFLCFSLFFFIFSFSIMIQNFYKVEIVSTKAKPVFEDEPIFISVTLENKSNKTAKSFRLKTNRKFTMNDEIDLLGKETGVYQIQQKSQKRGNYTLPPIYMTTNWPFSSGTCEKKFTNVNEEIYVYPKPLENGAPFPNSRTNSSSLEESNLNLKSQEEIHHLRDYQHGDRIKDIDWKATAKKNKAVSRVMTSPETKVFQLSWSQVEHLSYETAISQLATWIIEAEKQGYYYSLSLNNEKGLISKGSRHYHECMRALTLLPVRDEGITSTLKQPPNLKRFLSQFRLLS